MRCRILNATGAFPCCQCAGPSSPPDPHASGSGRSLTRDRLVPPSSTLREALPRWSLRSHMAAAGAVSDVAPTRLQSWVPGPSSLFPVSPPRRPAPFVVHCSAFTAHWNGLHGRLRFGLTPEFSTTVEKYVEKRALAARALLKVPKCRDSSRAKVPGSSSRGHSTVFRSEETATLGDCLGRKSAGVAGNTTA